MRFIGREKELDQLGELMGRGKSSLVTVQGRRRIGKSALVRRFVEVKGVELFEFQGLPPRPGIKNSDQLAAFARSLAGYLDVKGLEFDDWSQAFAQLAQLGNAVKRVVFLDEISWMGAKDPDFAGKLKSEWDRTLGRQDKMILVLCGSVSSWIQKNILDNTGFAGRISLSIVLRELPLPDSFKLVKNIAPKTTSADFARLVSVTGGVPRYLEEIDARSTAERNINRLCFQEAGFLFNEYDRIFNEVFGRKHPLYSSILEGLIDGPLQPSGLAKKTGYPLNGDLIESIGDLELGGFLRRDHTWGLSGRMSKISLLRISDNYSRFFLKYIRPRQQRLVNKPVGLNDSLDFIHWPVAFGFQFENLVAGNADRLCELIGVPGSDIVQLGPYFQSATKARPGVQIDYLIQCKKGLLYLCEIKSGVRVTGDIIREVMDKTKRLKIPRGFSVRHCLVHLGELPPSIVESGYFDRIIGFEDFLK
ncbi:MAG: hypothetical protein A2583_11770 [Bdellovibrionales bacterium RIFOXYD1_FULL_53_11]|nr:MAG: hypothetical protein A2583_11770 [Bdellovibrionales bacterium RIFOXYD1_FULL_53_11]